MRTTSDRSIPHQIRRQSCLAVSLALMLGIGACTTNPYTGEKEASKAGMGAGIGAVAGGLVGAIAGDNRNAILLGMGVEGHTGSLFPNSYAICSAIFYNFHLFSP